MENTKQPLYPVSYKIRDLTTVKATCERFIPFGKASSGVFRNTGKFEITQVRDSSNKLELSFERTVTGQPKGTEDGQIAFQATCKISCLVEFDHVQGADLPKSLLNALAAPIFYVAAERCRDLITGMGYPNPAIGSMPEMEALKPITETEANTKPVAKAKRARSKGGMKEAAKK